MTDRVGVVAQMAATLLTKYGDLEIQGNSLYIESCVKASVAIYQEAQRQVGEAYQTTSTDLPVCTCTIASPVVCPRHRV